MYVYMPSCSISLYQNFKYLKEKPISAMMQSAQFLHILKAESEHLVTVNLFLPSDVRATFERKLVDAISSDNFTESATAWNNERSRVIQEVMDQHLILAGIKWTREYIRDEVEDFLAIRCSEKLRSVRSILERTRVFPADFSVAC